MLYRNAQVQSIILLKKYDLLVSVNLFKYKFQVCEVFHYTKEFVGKKKAQLPGYKDVGSRRLIAAADPAQEAEDEASVSQKQRVDEKPTTELVLSLLELFSRYYQEVCIKFSLNSINSIQSIID